MVVELTYPQILEMRDTVNALPREERKQFFFTAGIRHRWNPVLKKFEVLILDYHRDGIGPLQIKFPGGCSDKGESPRECLRREMILETGRPLKGDAKIIHYKSFEKDGELVHLQIFFEQEIPFSDKTPFLKTATGSDNGECGPVRWEVISQELMDTMFKSHKPALQKLIRKLQGSITENDPSKMDKVWALVINF